MKKFLIKLLGGVSKEEHQSILDYFQSRMINPQNLDFASSLMKRWNEFRCSINYMYKEICINNADFFTNNSSLLHDLVLQDYYFRRLYLLQNGKDFFDNVEEHEKLFFSQQGESLNKAFWDIDAKYLELIYDNKFIKNWDKGIK